MQQVPEWVIIAAVRYALGRHTYVVSDTADLLRSIWSKLSPTTKVIVLRDIEQHLEDVRNNPRGHIHEMDTKVWKALYEALRRVATV